jgi:glycosyltransferase involved in cell wall biosynthesis
MKIAFMSSGTINAALSYRPLALGKELLKKGHDVYIFMPRFDKYSQFQDEASITTIDGIKIIRPWQIKNIPFIVGLIPYIFSSMILLHKVNPDIVHISKPTPITITGLVLKLTRKKRIIFDADDIDTEVMRIEENSPIKIALVALSEKLAKHFADAIVAASRFLQEMYASQYPYKIVAHISNGAEFTSTRQISLKKTDAARVIFIGNINRISILEPLFYALDAIKKEKRAVSAVIIGDGMYLDYFKSLVEKLQLTEQVTFLGRIPQNELYKYVQPGDIGYCYMPDGITQKACSNMKAFQYMQFGSVPLVSDVGDLPLYTFQGKAGYIAEHSNLQSLITAMREAVVNEKEKEEKIIYAINHAPTMYAWSVLAEMIEAIYKKIL